MQRINKADGAFKCEGCGKTHALTAWAAAHIDEHIGFKCESCGTQHDLRNWTVRKSEDRDDE